MADHSAGVAVRFHLALIAVQTRAKVHQLDAAGGRQISGPSSDFDRFSPAGMAMRCSASSMSFANAVRCSSVHAQAPERHALARGTVWSTSTADATVFTVP